MENPEALAAHRHVIERLIPLLDAIRSMAEIAWRRADAGYQPLMRYSAALQLAIEDVMTLLPRVQQQALLKSSTDGQPTGLLLMTAERGLCGAFNEQLVNGARQYAQDMAAQSLAVSFLCMGSRGQRLLEAAGYQVLYRQPMPSLSIPTYVDIENIALDLLDLVEQGRIGRLVVMHHAPLQRFQYAMSIRTLLPPDIAHSKPPGQTGRVKPADDAPTLITHLLTEHLIIGLYRALRESVMSEQLARVQAMRLATENAQKLLNQLTLEYHLAQSHAITSALLEIIAGYQATAHKRS